MRLIEFAPANQLTHHPAAVEPLHLHPVLQGRRAAKNETGTAAADRYDIKIDIRAEAAVQLKLTAAVIFPLFQGGEIEKTEVDRFLELIDHITGQQDIGDMGLHQLDPVRRITMMERVEKPGDIVGQRGG